MVHCPVGITENFTSLASCHGEERTVNIKGIPAFSVKCRRTETGLTLI